MPTGSGGSGGGPSPRLRRARLETLLGFTTFFAVAALAAAVADAVTGGGRWWAWLVAAALAAAALGLLRLWMRAGEAPDPAAHRPTRETRRHRRE